METRPGRKTTEFWTWLLVTLANLLNATGAWNFAPNRYSVIAQAIITGLYALSRGVAKAGVPAGLPIDPLAGAIVQKLTGQTQPPPAPTEAAPPQPPASG